MSVVAAPMSSRVSTSMRLRPSRSPNRPARTAPRGRNKKLMPIVDREIRVASPGACSFNGAKKRGANTRPAAWA